MQNRYAGDVGDYVKFALLRALSPGMKLGVAWYLFPDEGHNEDGKHTAYLHEPERWRPLDPELFDLLKGVVASHRSITAIERSGVLNAVFSNEILLQRELHHRLRSKDRADWFNRAMETLAGCDLVFADPDNGLTDDQPQRRGKANFGKQLPLQEALTLARGRTAVVYHHNSRFKGGHDLEVEHWRSQLGEDTIAVRANAYNCRTFFILTPTPLIAERARDFSHKWRQHRVHLSE